MVIYKQTQTQLSWKVLSIYGGWQMVSMDTLWQHRVNARDKSSKVLSGGETNESSWQMRLPWLKDKHWSFFVYHNFEENIWKIVALATYFTRDVHVQLFRNIQRLCVFARAAAGDRAIHSVGSPENRNSWERVSARSNCKVLLVCPRHCSGQYAWWMSVWVTLFWFCTS